MKTGEIMSEVTNPELPEDAKLKELYQLYLQKCCEVGQIEHQLEMLDSQRLEIEKNLDTTKRAARNAAKEHRELNQAKFSKLKAKDEPKLEMAN